MKDNHQGRHEHAAVIKARDFRVTHPAKCLICSRKSDCEKEGEVTIDQFAKDIDDNLQRLGENADFKIQDRLKKEGEKLKERMRKHGIANASCLFFIGRK